MISVKQEPGNLHHVRVPQAVRIPQPLHHLRRERLKRVRMESTCVWSDLRSLETPWKP